MIKLASHTVGSGSRRLVFLHGFTHTGSSWGGIARDLCERVADVHCELVDLPGHGGSHDRPTFGELVDVLVAATRDAVVVGYSMGARLAIAVACHPDSRLRGLVSIGGTAGIEDTNEREERRAADRDLAVRIRSIGTAAFLTEWMKRPIFAGYTARDDEMNRRLKNSADGLAYALEALGAGCQPSYWDEIARITSPATFVAGSNDAKFVSIARRMNALVDGSHLVVVPRTGHVTHLEAPNVVTDVLLRSLAR